MKNNRIKRILLVLVSALLLLSSILSGCSLDTSVSNIANNSFDNNTNSYFVEFTADTYDILIGEQKEVKFSAELADNTKNQKVEIIDENKKIIAEMNDAGEDGDDVADDNIYTAIVSLSNNSRDNISYYARVGKNLSESFDICFYSDLTEDEFKGYFELSKTINEMDDFNAVVKYVKTSKDVIEYEIDTETNTITYKSKYGITGVWTEFSSDYKGNGTLAIPESQGLDYEAAMKNVSFMEKKATLQKNEIAVLRPFRNSDFKLDDFKYTGEILASATGADLSVIDDENVDLDCMKNLDEYGLVLIDSHGMWAYSTPFIVIGEELNEVRFLWDPIYYLQNFQYSADYISGRIVCTNKDKIAVRNTFFDKYYKDKSFENSFIFLGICHGLHNEDLANAFIDNGAIAVTGYTDSVTTYYCNETMFETFINSLLLSYDEIDDAVANAKEIYGNIDPYKDRNEPECRFDLRGKNDYVLCQDIVIEDFTIPNDMVLTLGEIDVIEPETIPNDATGYSIKWTSSDESVATVTPTGKECIVTSKGKGTATITGELVSNGKTITKSTDLRVASKGRDTVLVLDTSGSMEGTPLEEMKKSAIQFCNDILKDEYNNRVGLVFYSDSISTVDLTNDLDMLINYINGIYATSTTNMEGGLAAAEEILDNQGKDDNIKNIVLMADGLPNVGATSNSGSMPDVYYSGYNTSTEYANAVIDTANRIMKNYNLYSLGFFHSLYGEEKDFGTTLMKLLTNVQDGYHQVEDAGDLQFAFGDIQETISDGSKIVINVACPVDVTVSYNGEFLSSAENMLSQRTSFGTLQLLGKNKDIKVLSLNPDNDYDIELVGTDFGTMEYSVNYIDEFENIVDFRIFESIPIMATTVITSDTNNEAEAITLNIDEDGDGEVDLIWSALQNSTATLTLDDVESEESEEPEEPEEPAENDNTGIILAVLLIVLFAIIGVAVAIMSTNKKKEASYNIPVITANEPPIEAENKFGKATVISGPMKGKEFKLENGKVYTIGKNPAVAQLLLSYDYTKVSREHCRISYNSESESYYIIDLSQNGTYFIEGVMGTSGSSMRKPSTRLNKNAKIKVPNGCTLLLANEDCMITLK